jgi:hypothetical protein
VVTIAGRDYPTPLLVGGVAGVAVLVLGERLLGRGRDTGEPAAPATSTTPDLGSTDVGQFPAVGQQGDQSGYDWWDDGSDGSPSFPPAPGPAPAPGPIPRPAPAPAPAPAPTTTSVPAGAIAKVTFPAGTYKTAIVSGSTFLRYGADMRTVGFGTYSGRPVILRNVNGGSTTWFRSLGPGKPGIWFYRWDPHIRWVPL